LAAGGVDVENAPNFLEQGATAVVVDRGLFPDTHDPAAAQVIRARASALVELCAEALGVPSRISLSDALWRSETHDAASSPPHRHRFRLLRRPRLRRSRDARGWAALRPHARKPRRADDTHPRRTT